MKPIQQYYHMYFISPTYSPIWVGHMKPIGQYCRIGFKCFTYVIAVGNSTGTEAPLPQSQLKFKNWANYVVKGSRSQP